MPSGNAYPVPFLKRPAVIIVQGVNLNRKHLLPVVAASVALMAFVAAARAQPPDSTNRPHFVYILMDDLGYGDIHAFNPERGKIATPNLDRLREQGMAFTDCHASASICSPSRYSLLTGRYGWRTRLQQGALPPEAEPLIPPTRLTVGEFLKQHGYATAAIGKWHLGMSFDKKDFSKPITDGPLQHGL